MCCCSPFKNCVNHMLTSIANLRVASVARSIRYPVGCNSFQRFSTPMADARDHTLVHTTQSIYSGDGSHTNTHTHTRMSYTHQQHGVTSIRTTYTRVTCSRTSCTRIGSIGCGVTPYHTSREGGCCQFGRHICRARVAVFKCMHSHPTPPCTATCTHAQLLLHVVHRRLQAIWIQDHSKMTRA